MSTVESRSTLSIEPEMLTPIIRCVLNNDSAEVVDFQSMAVTGGFETATAIYRVSGNAMVAGRPAPWRVILKVIQPITGNEDPQGFLYWRREVLAYRTGLLYTLPGKMTAPRCFFISEQPGGETWLWLEYVEDEVGKSWPAEHYGMVARHLGAFNGAYLTDCQIPSQPWIPRDWLRAYVEHAAPAIDFLQENLDHPLVCRLLPADTRNLVLTIWEGRERFFALLESLPWVFCHQDAFRGNLFSAHDQLVGIDWSYLGPAPVGAEIVPLTIGSMALSGFPAKQARQLEQVVFDGYIAGLADVGCRINPHDVRVAYCLTSILRYLIGGQVGQALLGFHDEESLHQLEAKSGKTSDEYIKNTNLLSDYMHSIVMEGMRMVDFNRSPA